MRESDNLAIVECETLEAFRDRLLGVSAAATDMRASIGRIDSTPVNTFGAAIGKSKAFNKLRIAGMTQSGTSLVEPISFFPLRGVFLPLSRVFGVFRADAGAEVVLLLGVCGSRAVAGAGKVLLR
jgi:hypothetical protein